MSPLANTKILPDAKQVFNVPLLTRLPLTSCISHEHSSLRNAAPLPEIHIFPSGRATAPAPAVRFPNNVPELTNAPVEL